ncbi:MAG: nucleoside monophosphate kinase [Clostridia bacterium]
MVYIITGGPATGKGTRSNILSKALNIPHISTGELLRAEAETNKEIADILSQGTLISDDLTTRLLFERITQKDCENGFILDGYPRNYSQISLLDNILSKVDKKVDKVIELVVDDELVYRRILERKICERCGKMYGIDFPPKVENICDSCGGKLSVRTDDTKDTLKSRIDTYKTNSKQILKYYKLKGVLKTVDAAAHPEDIIKDIKD